MNNIDKLGLTSSAAYDAGYKQGVADTLAGKPYDVGKEQAMASSLKEKVFTALGEASMCWDPIPTGVFDSTNAGKIGNKLLADLRA